MMTFLLVGIGVVLLIALLFVIIAAGGHSRSNQKPVPTAPGHSPRQGRAMGPGDN
jgi:hypothetical protein